MSRRGSNPSRARRTQDRAVERTAPGRAVMHIPQAIQALAVRAQHLPCLVDPTCTVDHLHRRRR